MLVRSIYKNSLVLGAFALLSIGLIALFHTLTKERILAEMEAKLARTLDELIPPSHYNNDVYHDCTLLASQDKTKNIRFYRMRVDNKPYATVFTTTAPDGYSGAIELIIGITAENNIAGVRVIEHNETPGLGDKIELKKSDWMLQFKALSLATVPADQWKVKKDGGRFDSFTGATITPRAVLSAIRRSLEYVEENKDAIFTQPSNCGAINERQ
ncbi:electron transport complex subunit RsxG [Pleionea sp. CnH1-48]|uniref:electron transport complex subunit RsxG n=1 Tax=Pleionea sp. CnH1-48 TaxID=2954494 RepID=UPI002097095A|nr:electron transport complex subunit RsxG [Pleionea sp. CnH1-48]MCO7222924.1 electron transport complex subunit RsxG [Pleionea sp. CnH1-48]